MPTTDAEKRRNLENLQTVEELGKARKERYPDSFQDLSDIQVGRALKQRYPDSYKDFLDMPDQWFKNREILRRGPQFAESGQREQPSGRAVGAAQELTSGFAGELAKPLAWLTEGTNLPGAEYFKGLAAYKPEAEEHPFAGKAGREIAQGVEQLYGGRILGGLARGLPLLGRAAIQGAGFGGMGYLQSGGDPLAAGIGAATGAGGEVATEAASKLAAKFAERFLGFPKRVPLELREEAAERAVQQGAEVPLTREEVKGGVKSLEPEIAAHKAEIDRLTKSHPVYSQRTIRIPELLADVDAQIAKLRPSNRKAAAALLKKRMEWADQLGFRPAEPARIDPISGKIIPAKPAQIMTSVEKAQALKESFGESIPPTAFGQGAKQRAITRGSLKARAGAQRAIEEALPGEYSKLGTVAQINHVIERDLRLKEALTDAVKRNPNMMSSAMGLILGELAGEIGGEAAGQLLHKSQVGGLSAGEAGQILGVTIAAASRNPRKMAQLLMLIRDAGVPAARAFTAVPLEQHFRQQPGQAPASAAPAPQTSPQVRREPAPSAVASPAGFPPARGETLAPAIATAIKQHEGWKEGSVSQRNNNPGNLKPLPNQRIPGLIGRDENGFGIFKDYDSGWNALLGQVNRNINKGFNLQQFFGGYGKYAGYAPAGDRNKPLEYAKTVGGWLGIDPRMPLTSLQ